MFTYINPLYINFLPSSVASITLAVIFFTLSSLHIALLKYTKRLFAIPFILGGLAEVAGYIARTVSRYDLANLYAYTAQNICIFLSPIVLNTGIHWFLGNVIEASTFVKYSILRPVHLSYLLAIGDGLGLIFQLWGTVKLIDPDDDDEIRWSGNIICGGLAIQVVVIGAFFVFASVFHSRLRKHNVINLTKPRLRISWSLSMLYFAGLLILVRTAYRIVQYGQILDGYLINHEWPLFAFDSGPMVVLMAMVILWYGMDLDVKEEPNHERALEIPLDRLASVSHTEALRVKSSFDGRIGQKTVITV
ncbi:RTA1-like protein 3 [Elsinoe australis]|uniref:RTA1-like protein 3 n=1 Tax=Elsinoe australis TaxID=40998 RepID=A0A4U7B557_9PEZI|nr:RTA1-like protein 3 [Elsinoe australis]